MGKEIKSENLEKAIIKTIVFFDMFDCPLTLLEIRNYCEIKCSLDSIIVEIEFLQNKSDVIREKNGLYFLLGRESIVDVRLNRCNLTNKKIKRAILVARIFKFIPWIKMIAMSGFKGPHNLRQGSDIDFFIVTEKNKIWVTRFFCIGFLKILNLRPKKNNKKNKICLSFYVSENNMSLEGVMLDESFDIDFIYWLACFVPIYDVNSTFGKFKKENIWIKKYLPNFVWNGVSPKRNAGGSFSRFYHNSIDIVFGGAEKIFKKIQLKILPKILKDLMNKDTRVVINDRMLKLHSCDKREEHRDLFQKKIKSLNM